MNHPHSERSKSRNGNIPNKPFIWPGALVFLKKDLTNLRGRELYIVVKIEENDNWCWIKKFVKQVRMENYRVNTTEICLAPNQDPQNRQELSSDEEEAIATSSPRSKQFSGDISSSNLRQNDSDEKESQPCHDYNLRKQQRKNYKLRCV